MGQASGLHTTKPHKPEAASVRRLFLIQVSAGGDVSATVAGCASYATGGGASIIHSRLCWRVGERELFWESLIELRRQRKEAAMHLHTYRDEDHSRHFDLVGHHWSIDLVAATAAGILVVGFACAVVALLVH